MKKKDSILHRLEAGEEKKYIVDRKLGAGTFGAVYKVYDDEGNKYAIKRLNNNVEIVFERLEREQNIAQRLQHPHIITPEAMFEDDGNRYLLMRCIEGETLKEKLEKKGHYTLEETVKFGEYFFNILGYMHSKHIFHRDVKPSNIIIDYNGIPNLIDFGLVRYSVDDETVTRTGERIGTSAYLPPEFRNGKPSGKVDYQLMDLYATTVIVYELLMGERPKEEQGLKRLYNRFISLEDHSKKKQLNYSKKLSQVIMKGLDKSPKNRYQSAVEFYSALQNVCKNETNIGVKEDKNKEKYTIDLEKDIIKNRVVPKKTITYVIAKGVQKTVFKKIAYRLMKRAAKKGDDRAINKMGEMYCYGHDIGKDYKKSKELFEKARAQGNIDAINNLGEMYYYGYGGEKEYMKAKELFEEAKAKNHIRAAVNLGLMYYYGHGVEIDYEKVINLFEQARARGYANPICELGEMYYYGYGVKKQYKKAIEFYKEARAKGDRNAMYKLGEMYYYGYGVRENYAEAKKYYEEAKGQNHGDAIYKLGKMYYYGYGVEKDYEIARELFRQAKFQGHIGATYKLGEIYYYGYGISKDYSLAQKMFYEIMYDIEISARTGGKQKKRDYKYLSALEELSGRYCSSYIAEKNYDEKECQFSASILYELGRMYYYGYGTNVNYKKTIEFYEKASRQGHREALYNLAEMYYYGYGVEKDYREAKKYYEEARVQNHGDASYKLGDMHYYGHGVERNNKKAIEFYEQAIGQGHVDAMYKLAEMYYHGYGVKRNNKKAIELYEQAKYKGHKDAINKLETILPS